MRLEDRLKSLAIEEGCIRAGVARRETFSEAPPSADMRYLKPWAEAVVSFAVSTGTDRIEDYLFDIGNLFRTSATVTFVVEIIAIIVMLASLAGYYARDLLPGLTQDLQILLHRKEI